MDILVTRVALFQDEGVSKELIEFVDYICFLVVCDATGELTQFSDFRYKISLNLVELRAN
jgi:hypothetical protein